jgi:hypothetical protein
LKHLLFEKIMNFYGSGERVVRNIPPPQDTAPQPEDSEVVSQIKELLETRIRPAVQEDGGDIVFKAFTDGVVFLKVISATFIDVQQLYRCKDRAQDALVPQ